MNDLLEKEVKIFMTKYNWFCDIIESYDHDVAMPYKYNIKKFVDLYKYYKYINAVQFNICMFKPKRNLRIEEICKKYNLYLKKPVNYCGFRFRLFIPFDQFDNIYTLNKLKFG